MIRQKRNMKQTVNDILCRSIARSVIAFLSRKYFAPTRQRISLSPFIAQP